MDELYLTVDEAARLARCNPKTIRRAFHSGQLKAYRPARRVLIAEQDLRAWIERHAAAAGDRPRPRARRGRPAPLTPGSVASLRASDPDLAQHPATRLG